MSLESINGWWHGLATPLQIFWAIGIVGLILITVQAGLALLSGHDGGDVHTDHEGHTIVSLRTISALCLGLGFGGAAFGQNGFSILFATLAGVMLGLAIATCYFFMMKGLQRLQSDGTALIWEAVGQHGTVYQRIPASAAGRGEIQVAFAGRMMNVVAVTRGPELPTGTPVVVLGVTGETVLEVEAISPSLSVTNPASTLKI